MAGNKRPRKVRAGPRQEKLSVWPLGMRKAIAFEMPGYQASLALGQAHFCEQHLYDLLSNADLTRRIAPVGHEVLPVAHSMVMAIAEIQDRAQRIGKLGVTGDEMQSLRSGLGKTMSFLKGVPNVAIARASAAALREFDKTGVLRV